MLLLLLLLLSLQACEVGFVLDVVQQELSGGCPTSRKPCEELLMLSVLLALSWHEHCGSHQSREWQSS